MSVPRVEARGVPGRIAIALSDASLRRFVASGVVNTALGFALFHAFLALYAGHAGAAGMAQASSYAIGIAVAYVLNRRWTFRSAGAHGRQLPRFVTTHLAALALSSVLIQVGVSQLGLPVTLCWVLFTGLATAMSFLLQRHWVFGHAAGSSQMDQEVPP